VTRRPTGAPPAAPAAGSAIWDACRDRARPSRIGGALFRVVESQEQVATSAIVDTAAEQAMLEDILEASKPRRRPGTAHLDYLLATAFRYPPLRHGSRFGSRFEPSLFYGSLAERTVLAEGAYYRFWFWFGMTRPPPTQQLITQHSVVRARYATPRGLRLQHAPFDAHADALRNPRDYAATQALGTALRAAAIDAFEYCSARDPGLNIAIFTPAVFPAHGRLEGRSEWSCMTSPQRVAFVNTATRATHEFMLGQFLVDGEFPDPAR
jgi:hypothetical protein